MSSKPRVAIVDYGMGNLFSVRCACEHAALDAFITSSPDEVRNAAGVILPGIGAFADAMATLSRLDLVSAIRDVAAAGTPLFGVCLGMQLLMTESHEFGLHRGLNVLEGAVVRLDGAQPNTHGVKVPNIGWNPIDPPDAGQTGTIVPWTGSPLQDLRPGTFMYFVHSYYVEPSDSSCVLATTPYGDRQICSALRRHQVFACQFHPERSGPDGLSLYRRFAASLRPATEE